MNCRIKETSAKVGVGTSLYGELSWVPCIINYSKQEETYVYKLRQESVTYITIQQEEENSALGQSSQSETVATQPMGSLPTLESQLPPRDSLLQLLQLSPFSYKSKFPFLVSGFASCPP